MEPAQFVTFIQNHDQIANSFRGDRVNLLCSPGRFRAMTALLLLGPSTPMLFQGQEFASSAPFLYFADHNPELAKLVTKGRREFLAQFPSLATKEMADQIAEPSDPETFARCKLDFSERKTHQPTYQLHRDLLALRRREIVPRSLRKQDLDGAVLGPGAFVIRYFGCDGDDRLLLVNFDVDLELQPAPEPLLAPPVGCRWGLHWSSEDIKYGGSGTGELETEHGWRLPGRATVLLMPRPLTKKV